MWYSSLGAGMKHKQGTHSRARDCTGWCCFLRGSRGVGVHQRTMLRQKPAQLLCLNSKGKQGAGTEPLMASSSLVISADRGRSRKGASKNCSPKSNIQVWASPPAAPAPPRMCDSVLTWLQHCSDCRAGAAQSDPHSKLSADQHICTHITA